MAKIKAKRGPESNLGNITLDDGEFAVTTDTHKLYFGFSGVKYCIGSASSLGDMLKSIYDTNNDGIVDNAAKAARDSEGNIINTTYVKKGMTWNDLEGV